MKGITCKGSHGLSVGSLEKGAGSTDTVKHVFVDGATMINSTEAVGFKFYPGSSDHGSPVTTNVTSQNIVLKNSDYAVAVEAYYGEDKAYCKKSPSTDRISDAVITNFSVTTSAKYVPTMASINCPNAGTCGLTMSGINVKDPNNSTRYLCSNNLKDLCRGMETAHMQKN